MKITKTDVAEFVAAGLRYDENIYIDEFIYSVEGIVGFIHDHTMYIEKFTLIKESISLIEKKYHINLDINNIPIDDEKTYAFLRQRKPTNELEDRLSKLQPATFTDLVAFFTLTNRISDNLNLMDELIESKKGTIQITQIHPDMEDILKETYGIFIYQDQVMQVIQKMTGFTKKEAKYLNAQFGKRHFAMNEIKPLFFERGIERGYSKEVLEKTWETFKENKFGTQRRYFMAMYTFFEYLLFYLEANYSEVYYTAKDAIKGKIWVIFDEKYYRICPERDDTIEVSEDTKTWKIFYRDEDICFINLYPNGILELQKKLHSPKNSKNIGEAENLSE